VETRAKDPATRAAVYYNTLSLHDGNILQSEPHTKSAETYKARVGKLLTDMQGFIDKLEKSGRRAVVVLIPEHGAAWRGDAAQIAGLREIPTPAITLVPVGVRVIGPDAKRIGDAVQVAEPASFLALSDIVAKMLAKPPYGAEGFKAQDYAAAVPATPFVSETEAATVLGRGNGYLIRQERDAWKELR
jgi:cellulose synthase operon protein YhjU